jgi:ABC-type Na+ transport system ATPase subunit NatA/multidrug resistance efflux pump
MSEANEQAGGALRGGGARRALKRVVPVVFVLLAAGFLVWYLFLRRPAVPENVVAVSGRVEGDDAGVAAKTSGRIREITVRAGQTLATLDDEQVRAREEQAQSSVAQADARVARAQEQIAVLEAQLEESRLAVEQARTDATGRVHQAEAQVAAAQAQLAQAEAAYGQAHYDAERFTRLAASGDVPERSSKQAQSAAEAQAAVVAAARRQVEAARGALTAARASAVNPGIRSSQEAAVRRQIAQAQADVEAAQADRARAQAQLEEARTNRKDLEIVAPFDGTVATRTAEPGEVVAAGTPVLTIVNLGEVYLRAFVPEGDVGRVRVGQPARLSGLEPEPARRGLRRADRSASLLHAGEHLLPQRPRAPSLRRAAATQERGGLRQAGDARRRRDTRRRRHVALREARLVSAHATTQDAPASRAPDRAATTAANSRAAESRYAVRVRDLRKGYGETEAVSGVSFDVRRGEIFGLIGPDGAGKTSVFQILGGVMRQSGGEALMLGRPARGARSFVGYLTQAFSLYQDLSVAENLRYVGELRRIPEEEIRRHGRRYLRAFDMDRFQDRLAGRLSGGMKQKLALACALVGEPKILLLDEPTTGVDPVSRREFWDALARLSSEGMPSSSPRPTSTKPSAATASHSCTAGAYAPRVLPQSFAAASV